MHVQVVGMVGLGAACGRRCAGVAGVGLLHHALPE